MAAQGETAAQVVDPQLVANSFVEQYYKVLHDFPDLVHRFYQDSSVLGRPGPKGVMTSISTMNTINEQIISLEYHRFQTEILTVDAQGSYCSGVIVLVTGFLTGKDNVKRKFVQSFFLAPQEKGFFVLNDVFRYVDDHKDQSIVHQVVLPINGADQTAPPVPSVSNSESIHAIPKDESILINHEIATSQAHEDHTNNINNGKKLAAAIVDPSTVKNRKANANSTESSLAAEKESLKVAAAAHPHPDPVALKQTDTRPDSSDDIDSQDASSSKKSFASIVNALKDNAAPFKAPPPKPIERSRVASASKASAPTPTTDTALRRHDNSRPVAAAKSKGFSIFVANLPIDATVEQLKEMFEKFGPIIPNGAQIRTNKLRPNCFGFVEFETVTSMLSAIQASPIVIANRKFFVEEKKAGSDSTLKPTPVSYDNNNYKVTSNSSVGYQSNNYKVTSNGRNPPITTGRNAARESSRVPQKEGGRRFAYQAKV